MDCEHAKMSQGEFNKKSKFCSSRKEYVFFLMNTLNLIKHNGCYYCYYQKYLKKRIKGKKQ